MTLQLLQCLELTWILRLCLGELKWAPLDEIFGQCMLQSLQSNALFSVLLYIVRFLGCAPHLLVLFMCF